MNMKRFTLLLCLAAGLLTMMSSYVPRYNVRIYPYETRHMDFVSQKQTVFMAYMYEKPAKPNGKTVLLLHGKNFSCSYWGDVMSALLSADYTVVAPDQIGFGKSTMPAAYQYSFQQLAFNTKLLLDSLGVKKTIVLGHSMGGMLAMRFAMMYPDATEQLILEDPIGLEDYKQYVPFTTVDDFFKEETMKTRESVKQYMMKNYFHDSWRPDYDTLLRESTHEIGTPAFGNYCWSMALTSDMIMNQPVCYELDKIKAPTVLFVGMLDRTALGKDKVSKDVASKMGDYPSLGKATAKKIPNCQLIEMQGLGHIPHIEDTPAFLKELMRVIR